MSVYFGDGKPYYNSLVEGKCAECGKDLAKNMDLKIVYDFAVASTSVELCPGCAQLVAARILNDVIHISMGSDSGKEFWKKRRDEVYEKVKKLNSECQFKTPLT